MVPPVPCVNLAFTSAVQAKSRVILATRVHTIPTPVPHLRQHVFLAPGTRTTI